MAERIEVRPYRPEDLEAVAALDNICFAAPFRFSKAAVKRFAERRGAIVRVAWAVRERVADDEAAGFCIVHMERARRPYGYFVTLDVDPHYRRSGIGQALMHSAEDLAREAGALEMMLHVSVENKGAIQLYERLGYRPLRIESGFYGEGGDAVVYSRVLRP